MRRSEINRHLREAIEFLAANRFALPAWADWSPAEWERLGPEGDEIRDCRLGWDITDFGSGDFEKCGLILFTIRNGHPTDSRYPKTYCEKVMVVGEGQMTPMHFHWQKREDIIVRAGGDLAVQLYNAGPDERLSDDDVTVSLDGIVKTVPAGTTIRLSPGESITLSPRQYHKFWGEPGRGRVLVGEVSAVNDDERDNRFLEPVGRFPEVEEDEPPLRLLCFEYPRGRRTTGG